MSAEEGMSHAYFADLSPAVKSSGDGNNVLAQGRG